jgi:membrane-bound ClpP family serine protease
MLGHIVMLLGEVFVAKSNPAAAQRWHRIKTTAFWVAFAIFFGGLLLLFVILD